jgi:hypothetical protein
MASSHEETQDAPIMDGAKEEWAAKRAEDAEKGPGEHLGGSGGIAERDEDGHGDDADAPIYDSRSTEHTTNHRETTDVREASQVSDPIEAAQLDQTAPGTQESADHEPARPGTGDEHSVDGDAIGNPDVETHQVENETDPDIDPEPRQA